MALARTVAILALASSALGGCLNAEPPLTSSKLPMCTEWEGKPSCCSPESLTALLPTLAGLSYHFDRCMSCAENWERVLCTAACSLNQDQFVVNSSVIDPRLTLWGEERRFSPLRFTMMLEPKLCDKLWYSCEADDTSAFSLDGRKATIHYSFTDDNTLANLEASNTAIKNTLSSEGLSARGAAIENSFSSFSNFTSSIAGTASDLANAGTSFVNALRRVNGTAASKGRKLFCEMMSARGAPGLGLSIALSTTDPVVRRSARPVLPACPVLPTSSEGGASCTDVAAVGSASTVRVCQGGSFAMPANYANVSALTDEVNLVDLRCAGRVSNDGHGGVQAAPNTTCLGAAQGLSPLGANRSTVYANVAADGNCSIAYFDCELCYKELPPVELKLSPTRAFNLDIVVAAPGQCVRAADRVSGGRCGPLYGYHPCTLPQRPYCNEANGWCGATNAHKNAQPGTTFDFGTKAAAAKPRPPVCLMSKDVEESDSSWNGYEFCYLAQNNQLYLSRSAGHTMEYVVLLIAGALVANLFSQSNIDWFPPCMSYVVMGAVLGAAALKSGFTSPDDMKFDSQFFTFFLLPPIIFAEGFTMNIRYFSSNSVAICSYAIVGTLIATIFLANVLFATSQQITGVWDFPELSFNEALAFSAMICATDPVATCDTFNEHAVDHLMEILVVGEALVNDAAAIVLYKTFKEWVLYEDGQNAVSTVKAFTDFSKFVAVSMLIGLCVAVICSLVYKHFSFKGNPGLEITVFLLMAYSTFLIAEFFHVSGILSSLVGGTTMAYYAQRSLSDYSQLRGQDTAVKGMLQMLAALSNMVIFLMVGMALVVCFKSFSLLFTLLVLVFTLCARALAIFPLTWLLNKFRSEKIPYNFAVMMWWSGLRGAVALALAVDMPSRHRFMMVSTTCVLVTFTVLVYGGSTVRMLKILKIRTNVPEDDCHDDHDLSVRMQAWNLWNARVLVPLLSTKPPPLLDGEAKAELANDELSLTKKALQDKTKELSEYARTKDRQIEKILKKAEQKESGCTARILACFFNPRCFLVIFNGVLVALALAAIVGGAIVLRSDFGTGDLETSMHYFIVASSFVLLCALVGFFGACTKSRAWLYPYTLMLLITMALEVAALALAYEVEGSLQFAQQANFDAAQYRAKEERAMGHIRAIANSTFAVNHCATTHTGTKMAFTCDSAWLQTFANERCATLSDAPGFAGCESSLGAELRGTTEIFCACRAAVVALIDEHSVTMAGIGIGVVVLELFLLIFACTLICSPPKPSNRMDEAYLDAVFEDKDVIKCTKALSDAKEAAAKKLKAKNEREQAKFAKQAAKLEAKKAKSAKVEEKEKVKAARIVGKDEKVDTTAMAKSKGKKGTKTVV